MSEENESTARNGSGKLRLFVGAAPGVGKTYTMLREAQALRERGIDVVIGYVDHHDRPDTKAMLGSLEVIERKKLAYQGRVFEEIDLDFIVQRHPEVIVIDELAHSNIPGSRHAKRYLDVEYILDHGIDVLTAVNVQHIENIHEEAQDITGVPVREIIPTSFVKRANEIEVIDVTPETLRQRLRDGSIYPVEKIEQALSHFFRKSNLSALRELALREVADDVDERLQRSFERAQIPGPVGAKETILVCVNFLQRARNLIETGERMAKRMKAELLILTILESPVADLSVRGRERLEQLMAIVREHEAEHIIEHRNDRKLGEVIIAVATKYNVTQIVIGQPTKGRKWTFWKESPVHFLMQHMKYFDVRIVGWKE